MIRLIYATPACTFGHCPTNANVYELSTSVTPQQGIFVYSRAPSLSELPLTGCLSVVNFGWSVLLLLSATGVLVYPQHLAVVPH